MPFVTRASDVTCPRRGSFPAIFTQSDYYAAGRPAPVDQRLELRCINGCVPTQKALRVFRDGGRLMTFPCGREWCNKPHVSKDLRRQADHVRSWDAGDGSGAARAELRPLKDESGVRGAGARVDLRASSAQSFGQGVRLTLSVTDAQALAGQLLHIAHEADTGRGGEAP